MKGIGIGCEKRLEEGFPTFKYLKKYVRYGSLKPNYMFWVKNIIIATALLSLPAFALASDEMSWDACVRETAENNPEVLSAKSTLDSSAFKAKAAYSGFMPQVAGDINYNKGNFSTGSQGSVTTGTLSASVTVQQNIFAGFRDKATVDQTAATRDANAANLEKVKVDVSYDLKSAFAGLLSAQDYSNLEDEIIERRRQNLAMVELRFEGGMENLGSLLLSKASLAQAKYEKHQAVHAISVARQQLAQVLGRSDASDITTTGRIPIGTPENDPNFETLALDTPDYIQAVKNEQAAKASVTLAKSQFSPTLDAFATAARQGQSWPPTDNNTTVGVNVSVPIFNGTSNIFNLKSSRSDLMAAKFGRTKTEQDLLPKLKQAYANFIDAHEKLIVDREFVKAAQVRAEIARNKYKNGLLSFEDWDIIENDLISKQQTLIQTEHNLYIAEATWMKTQGKGVIP